MSVEPKNNNQAIVSVGSKGDLLILEELEQDYISSDEFIWLCRWEGFCALLNEEGDNSFLNLSKFDDEEKKQIKNIILDFLLDGIIVFPLRDKKPLFMPKTKDKTPFPLENLTIEHCINAFKEASETRISIDGILVRTGKIDKGIREILWNEKSEKDKYFFAIDIDNEDRLKEFLEVSQKESISNIEGFWVENHIEPEYKTHIIGITNRKIQHVDENSFDNIGLGVFSEENKWVVVAPSLNINPKSNPKHYPWRRIDSYPHDSYPWKEFSEEENERNVDSLIEILKKVYEKHDVKFENNKGKRVSSERRRNEANNNMITQLRNNINNLPEGNDDLSKIPVDELINHTIKTFKPYYKENSRNNIIFSLSGFLLKLGYSLEEGIKVVDAITEEFNDTYEKQSRLRVVENTFNKIRIEGEENIRGKSGLWNILSKEDYLKFLKPFEKKHIVKRNFVDDEYSEDVKKEILLKRKKWTSFSIMKYMTEGYKFFEDTLGNIHGFVSVNDHYELIDVEDEKFSIYLQRKVREFYDELEKELNKLSRSEDDKDEDFQVRLSIPSIEEVKNFINQIKGNVIFSDGKNANDKINLYMRVGEKKDIVDNKNYWFYDLVTKDWESVKITSDGWDIVQTPPIFKRLSFHSEQVKPVREYDPDIMDKYLNLLNIGSDDDLKFLVKCYLISMFIPNISHPILTVNGNEGNGKTMFGYIIKKLFDPSSIDEGIAFPANKEEIIKNVAKSYFTVFDNISYISNEVSDILCRITTGSNLLERKLYTNSDEVVYKVKRPTCLNGITVEGKNPDLLSRMFIIDLPIIERKKEENVLKEEVKKIMPQLLGYIFDILVKVKKMVEEEKDDGTTKPSPDKLIRLADFNVCGEYVSMVMGNKLGKFTSVYQEKVIKPNKKKAIEQNDLVKFVQKYMELHKNPQEIRPELFLNELTNIAISFFYYDRSEVKQIAGMKSTKSLGSNLKKLQTTLRGMNIIFENLGSSDSKRLYRFTLLDDEEDNKKKDEDNDKNKNDNNKNKNVFDKLIKEHEESINM